MILETEKLIILTKLQKYEKELKTNDENHRVDKR